jgi:dTDP-L-rhamnose 4-epimerase
MRVLLTGSAGFIGSAISRELLRLGHEVVGVDVLLAQAHGGSAAEAPSGSHHLDVRDVDGWSELLVGVDVVCHQAALVGAGVTVADLPAYAAHNDLGTAALLAAMHDRGVRRLVLASSMVVYGEGSYRCPRHGEQTPVPRSRDQLVARAFENQCGECAGPLDWDLVSESARLDPRSAYAASKVAQEHYASAWTTQAGSSTIALRYHNVYGPGMPRDTPYSGVAAMFRSSIERGEAPQVYEDGGQMRDFVHVEDVARANVLALEAVLDSAPAHFCAFNVSSGRPISIASVAELVASGLPGAVVPEITGAFRIGDVRHVVASPALARSELGFSASVTPEAGLVEFATAPLRGSPN